MPKGAEFGIEASQLSAPQGAGAQPLEGVRESSYTPNLAPIANLAEGAFSLFKNFQKNKAEEDNNAFLSDLAEKVSNLDQGATTGQITKDEAERQRRMLYQKAYQMRPSLADDLRKQASFNQEFGISGAVHADIEAERKQKENTMGEMMKAGIPVSQNDPPALYKQKEELYLSTIRTRQQIQEYRDTVKFNIEKGNYDRAEGERILKTQSETLLSDLGTKHFSVFASQINSVISAIEKGLPIDSGKAQLREYFQSISGQIAQLANGAPEAAARTQNLFTTQYKEVEDLLKPGGDLKALKDTLEKKVTLAKLEFMKMPGAPEATALSELFKNHPVVLSGIYPAVQLFMGNATKERMEGDKPLPQIVGHSDLEGQAQGVIKKLAVEVQNGDAKTKLDFTNLLDNFVDQYHDGVLTNKLTAQSRDSLFKTLGDPNVLKYIRENQLGSKTTQYLTEMYDKAYVQEFQNSLQSKIFEQFQKTGDERVGLADWVLARSKGAKPGQYTSALKDLVKIEHNGTGLVITPINKSEQSQKAADEMRKAASAATHIVNIGAALMREDPKTFWDDKRSVFLPGMGYPPPKEKAAANKQDVEALSRELTTTNDPERKRMLERELAIANGTVKPPADSMANQSVRSNEDIRQLEQELSRKDLTPYMRGILEAELKKKKGGV